MNGTKAQRLTAVNQTLDIDEIERGIRQSIAAVNEQIQRTLGFAFMCDGGGGGVVCKWAIN